MYRFTDENFPGGFGGGSIVQPSAQMSLLMECHRASRLLQRLQTGRGHHPLHSPEGMPDRSPASIPGREDEALPAETEAGFRAGRKAFEQPGKHQPYGSVRGQGRLLHLLTQADGVLIKDIVMSLDIRPSSASELVAKLEKQGLVRVESDSEDKRARKVYLTDEGKALSEKIKSSIDSHTNELLDALSEDEQGQLLTLLRKLNAGLAEKGKEHDRVFGRGHQQGGHEGRSHERGGQGHHSPGQKGHHGHDKGHGQKDGHPRPGASRP